jgi:hypothetical protein
MPHHRLFVCCLALAWATGLGAQKLTYYRDIEPILARHCVSCHRAGEVAPFPLDNYEEVEKRAAFIAEVTQARYMPPWFADPAFSRFHNERGLPEADIQKIADWVAQGKKKGKSSQGIDIQQFVRDSLRLEAPDFVLEMNKDFLIPGDNSEQFRIFVIPTNLPEDVYVRGVEFVPGNRRLAHHARIMVDTTNRLRADDGIQVGATSEFEQTGVQMFDNFWYGWVPGNLPVFYPEGVAKRLPKNADLVISMHYSPSPVEAVDRSKIRFFLSKKKPERPVKNFILDEDWITNPPFWLPANNTATFYMRSPKVPVDLKLLSVLPHMHKLGRSFKTWAITPKGDIVPLLKIDRWNFNWQTTYQFKAGTVLPKGSVVYAEALYDNTADNPVNPNFPPQDVTYGWGTAQEMMNLIFEYTE